MTKSSETSSASFEARVVHCKKEPYDIYIGRPSKWGNPFSHKDGTKAEYVVSTRKEAVDRYGDYLRGTELINDLHELEGKVLGCWCKPKSCHGDVLVRLLREGKYGKQSELF